MKVSIEGFIARDDTDCAYFFEGDTPPELEDGEFFHTDGSEGSYQELLDCAFEQELPKCGTPRKAKITFELLE